MRKAIGPFRRPSEQAVSSTYAFMIAIGIMMASIAAVFVSTSDLVSRGVVLDAEQVNLQSEADSLLRILIESPGVISDGSDWDEAASASADDLVRLGLKDPDSSTLQIEKLANLRGAPATADDADGFANYDEATAALGLDDKDLGFHVRTKPALASYDEVLQGVAAKDSHLRIAYIGNVSSVTFNGPPIDEGLILANLACDESPIDSKSWRYSIDITNGGIVSTQFMTVFEIDSGSTVTRQDQTGSISPAETVSAWVDVANTADVDCDAATEVTVSVIDAVQQLRSELMTSPTIGTTPSSTTDPFYIETEETYFATTDAIPVHYDGNLAWLDALTLEVRQGTDPAGTLEYSDLGIIVPVDPADWEAEVPSGTLSEGVYTAYMTHVTSGVESSQRLLITDTAPNAYTPSGAGSSSYQEGPSVPLEVEYLSSLFQYFCPTYYNDTDNSPSDEEWDSRCDWKASEADGGDVFPSLKAPLRDELVDRIQEVNGTASFDVYNTIVVGSNVAHNVMTSGAFKWALQDWVDGGGTLIVYGSPEQTTQWMQPVFEIGEESSSGGISAPDVGHPLLTTPSLLSYGLYETYGDGWSYDTDLFTTVVQEGGTGITAISNPGAFGEGTIIMTSWLPFDVYGTGSGTSQDEGMALMHNFVIHAYGDLFLDYGPELPTGVPVVPAYGVAQVDHPDLGLIVVAVTVFVFPEA